MIVGQSFEELKIGNTADTFCNNTNISLKDLTRESKEICSKWRDYIVDNEKNINFKLNDDMQFIYKTTDGEVRKADISEYAFGQLCTRIGVPGSYVRKCFDNGKIGLAIQNFKTWANDCDKKLLIREHEGVVRAVLSDSYKLFDSSRVLKTLQNSVDSNKYKANGVLLSSEKLHIRFVNKEPLEVENENSKIFNGFTVTSSDVGRGSLAMNYFLYRQVCQNGMTITESGGTLFRQTHIGSKMTDGKLELFNKAFLDIEDLNEFAVESIRENQDIKLKDYELNMYLEKIKREMKLSEKSKEKLIYLIDSKYNHSRWGLLNSITELAQDFTLDTRIDLETFAGNLMIKVA